MAIHLRENNLGSLQVRGSVQYHHGGTCQLAGKHGAGEVARVLHFSQATGTGHGLNIYKTTKPSSTLSPTRPHLFLGHTS